MKTVVELVERGSFSSFSRKPHPIARFAIRVGHARLLADVFAPGFEILLYLGHELISDGSIDEAMIVAERQMNDAADGD